jgi:hypothetical protein
MASSPSAPASRLIHTADPALGLDPRVHHDIAEVHTEQGYLDLFVAISRQQTADPISKETRPGGNCTAKFAFSVAREGYPTDLRRLSPRPGRCCALPDPHHCAAICRRHAWQSRARLTDNSLPRT